MEYYIYSEKGWWGKSSTFTSDVEKAKVFTRYEAIAFCRARVNKELDAMGFVPVLRSDIEEVLLK